LRRTLDLFENHNRYTIEDFDFDDEHLVSETIDLLKTVFANTEFTRSWWDWKYKHNPFGKPIGWYALLNGKIVGVRLAIPNRFRLDEDVYSAYQMVDTATHPEYGKKGIFTALTKKAVEKIRSENSFIFNFPNGNSLPGYISLGWKKARELSWCISPTSFCALLKRTKTADFTFPTISDRKYIENCCTDWNEESLRWRFKDHPYNEYSTFMLSQKDFVIYKIRKIKGLKAAVVMTGDSSDHNILFMEFLKHLSRCGVPFVAYNGMNPGFESFLGKRMLSVRSSSKINYVTKDLPEELENRIVLDLADTDYH